jgi:hypothetical protein
MRTLLAAAIIVLATAAGSAAAALAQPRQGPPKPEEAVATAPAAEELQIPTGEQWLGIVRIPIAVLADGQPLPAGRYRVRLTGKTAEPKAVGQLAMLERWVEFVQGKEVKGRAMAPVVPSDATQQIAEAAPPRPGRIRVERLKEDDYLRIWCNVKGDQVLVYLPVQSGSAAKPAR